MKSSFFCYVCGKLIKVVTGDILMAQRNHNDECKQDKGYTDEEEARR